MTTSGLTNSGVPNLKFHEKILGYYFTAQAISKQTTPNKNAPKINWTNFTKISLNIFHIIFVYYYYVIFFFWKKISWKKYCIWILRVFSLLFFDTHISLTSSPGLIFRLNPKSINLRWWLSGFFNMMFSGFKSRWAMCLLCICFKPKRICWIKFEASSSDKRSFSDMKSNNSPPRSLKLNNNNT